MTTLEKYYRTTIAQRPLWVRQAVKFLFIGVLNTALDIGLYLALTRWLGLASLPVVAKSVSYSAGVINSFFWNKSWTFRSKASAWVTLAPFVLANLAGLAVNAGVMQLYLKGLNLPEIVAFGLATASTLAWNFVISKFVIFR